MYGQHLYGLINYGHNPVTETNPEDYFVDLARYVPPYLKQFKELMEIYQTEGYEVGALYLYYMEDLLAQAFISTATWGLVSWESEYGIATNLSQTYEERREILLAKLRGQGTTTKEMIRQTAETFSGGEVEVIEDNPNHFFIVRFVGIKGIPKNMNAFVNMLEDIKPAHLSYKFEYRYTVWNSLNAYKWDDLNNMTWGEIRTMKEE